MLLSVTLVPGPVAFIVLMLLELPESVAVADEPPVKFNVRVVPLAPEIEPEVWLMAPGTLSPDDKLITGLERVPFNVIVPLVELMFIAVVAVTVPGFTRTLEPVEVSETVPLPVIEPVAATVNKPALLKLAVVPVELIALLIVRAAPLVIETLPRLLG